MKTEWDYTSLADAYLKRPDYADSAVDAILERAFGAKRACDIGAGVAHLTLMLARRGVEVDAVEPNDAMRAHGISRTRAFPKVRWFEGSGENTGRESGAFDLVTFGSSFNVCDRPAALRETARLLTPSGWFACLWNHRRLDDPVQHEIESIIRRHVTGYDYGARREDQTPVIDASGLFGPVETIEGQVLHRQSVLDCIEAWRSHATLQRQAGASFNPIIDAIAAFLRGLNRPTIDIPYQTRVWMARRR